MKINPGVGYTSANLGEASGLVIDSGYDSSARNIGRQFECSITGAKVGDSYEYRLHVRKGLVEYDQYRSDENGIIDLDSLGGINDKNIQNMFFYINKFNVFPEESRTEGTEEKSEFINKNGYIKLTTGKDYFVFLYKTTPDWKESNDLWEAKAPQIGVSGVNDEPNNFIRTRRNGGGFLQSYIRLSDAGIVDNVVTADPLSGKIASFNPAEMLNDYINFDPSYLSIIRAVGNPSDPHEKHPDQYPTGEGSLSNYLGTNKIPSFLFKSSNPYTNTTFDGNTISGVPFGINWEKGTGGGGGAIAELTSAEGTSSTYPNQGDELNGSAIDVIVGDDTAASPFPYNPSPTTTWAGDMAKLNIMTGIIDVNDYEVIIFNDLSDNHVVNFDEADLDIIASSQTAIKTVGEMTEEGTGYVTTDCYRQDIAYIQWDAALNRFQIYQMQYGPIKMRQNPLGSFKNKLLKTPEEEAKWDTGFDICDDITGSFTGYTKDLNHAYYVPPDVEQLPYYAGQIAIGEYQSPKETL